MPDALDDARRAQLRHSADLWEADARRELARVETALDSGDYAGAILATRELASNLSRARYCRHRAEARPVALRVRRFA